MSIRSHSVGSLYLVATLFWGAASAIAHAETRGYVVSWFATATYNEDMKSGCPEGRNGGVVELHARELMSVGFTKEQAQDIQRKARDTDNVIPEYADKIYNRAQFDGKPVSIYTYPDYVPDPQIETYVGRHAYGFDLGTPAVAAKFEDPETHQPVDNQLWRAVGCLKSYLATPPQKPFPEDTAWSVIMDSAPAWAIQISGADLSKDGKVTVTLDRATQHLERDATSEALRDATYVIDPNLKSHNVLQGEIRGGVLSVIPQHIYLESEMPFYADIELYAAHMRVKLLPDGKLVGYLGGFLDWHRYAYMYTARPGNDADALGMYHALKKLADAAPDPNTGQNQQISATFRMEAVPAFLANGLGKVVATPIDASPAEVP